MEKELLSHWFLRVSDSQQELLQSYPYMIDEGDQVILVSEKGVGFCFQLEGLDSIKRNGKRASKTKSLEML